MKNRLRIIPKLALFTTSIIGASLFSIPEAYADITPVSCADVTILGARGTGEDQDSTAASIDSLKGFGESGGLAALKLFEALNAADITITVDFRGIVYPARGADPSTPLQATNFISSGSFDGSVKEGVAKTISEVHTVIDACPKTQVVMMGYSQGAEVMHEAANVYFGLHPERSGNLSKLWLVSDPTTWHVGVQDVPGGASYFNEAGEGFIPEGQGLISLMANNKWGPTDVGGPFNAFTKDQVVEVCHTLDSVCNTNKYYGSVEEVKEVAAQLSLLNPLSNHGTKYKDHTGTIHSAPSENNAPEIARSVASMRVSDGATKMVTTWDTSLPGCSNITIPLSGNINAKVNWGDGSFSPITASNPSHQYSLDALGTKTVTVTGTFTEWKDSPSAKCILEVTKWDLTGTTNLDGAFKGAVNLTKIPNIPASVTSTSYMLDGATSFNYPIGNWDVSNVRIFTGMFRGATSFNQPIGNWNVSKGVNLSSMFEGATSFNQPIGNWNVSVASLLTRTFKGATSFNQPIGNWNVSRVQNFDWMFQNSSSFNQPIGNWNLAQARSMRYMFMDASSFNQDLHTWKPYSPLGDMFQGCPIIPEYKPRVPS